MVTRYAYNDRNWVRYYYDTTLRLWTCYKVTVPNDEADQIGDALYCLKDDLSKTIDDALS